MSAAFIIACHLNVPYGPIVGVQDVIDSMRSGRIVASSKDSKDILMALFCETTPDLLLRCAREENIGVGKLQQLYEQTMSLGMYRVPEWEKAMREILPCNASNASAESSSEIAADAGGSGGEVPPP